MTPDEERVAILEAAIFGVTKLPESKVLAEVLTGMLGEAGWALEFDPLKAKKHFDAKVAATPIGLADPNMGFPPEKIR